MIAEGRRPRYSLVIPIFNEEAVLPLLIRRIKALLDQLDGPSEAIFVDDGSRDTSAIYLREMAATDPRIRLIELSRNFGHQIAITAGMDAADGDAVIVMDADLQDPPEVVARSDRQVERGLRDRLCPAHQARGRDAVQALDGQAVLPGAGAADLGRHPARRRRFPADRPQGARQLQEHAGARPLRARHVRLDGLQADRSDLRARRRARPAKANIRSGR